ncbi:MAG: 50S ribosomal protein L32 [Clostridia bacterium]|nr:50S ribosomal protein L32 [Clostridia bacterium]
MAVPKKKVSKARRDKRRSQNSKLTAPTIAKCPKCGEFNLYHRVCSNCGTYRGEEIKKVD